MVYYHIPNSYLRKIQKIVRWFFKKKKIFIRSSVVFLSVVWYGTVPVLDKLKSTAQSTISYIIIEVSELFHKFKKKNYRDT